MMVVVLPQGGPRARFLFDFDARACLAAPEQSLNARTGHVATFTRLGSIQQAADSAGILQRFASNLPAFQWNTDPVTGLSTPGVLLEVGATNLIVQSSDFANGVWGNVNVTVTANAITAPDGTLTADKLAATATGSALLYQFITTTATRASYSVYVKRGSGDAVANRFLLRNYTTATALVQCQLNYATGVLTVSSGTASVEAYANGWYRVILSTTSGITVGDQIVCYACFDSSAPTAGDYAYAWGAQCEVGGNAGAASSYIPTTSVAVARAATLLQYQALNVPPSSLTVYSKLADAGYNGTANATAWIIANNSGTSPYFAEQIGYGFFHSGALQSVSTIALTNARGAMIESIETIDASGAIQVSRSVNGGAIVVAAKGIATTPFAVAFSAPRLSLGGGTAFASGNVAMQVFRIAAGVRTLDYMRQG
jgi:hypothetical protein